MSRTLCVPLDRMVEYQQDWDRVHQAWLSAFAIPDAFDRALAKAACQSLERAFNAKWAKFAQ